MKGKRLIGDIDMIRHGYRGWGSKTEDHKRWDKKFNDDFVFIPRFKAEKTISHEHH